jgi:hypothetical protein
MSSRNPFGDTTSGASDDRNATGSSTDTSTDTDRGTVSGGPGGAGGRDPTGGSSGGSSRDRDDDDDSGTVSGGPGGAGGRDPTDTTAPTDSDSGTVSGGPGGAGDREPTQRTSTDVAGSPGDIDFRVGDVSPSVDNDVEFRSPTTGRNIAETIAERGGDLGERAVVGAAEVVGADPSGGDRQVLGNIGRLGGSLPGSAGLVAADAADAGRFVTEPARDAVEPGSQLGADELTNVATNTADRTTDLAATGADAGIEGVDRRLDIDFDRRDRGEGAAIQVTDDPDVRNQVAAELGAGAVSLTAGSAATSLGIRAAEIGSAGARVRAAGRGGPDIDIDETTRQPDQVAAGDQPTFETPTDVDAEIAADELRERSREVPDELQEAAGSEQVTFRSEAERLPNDLEARSGNFELPGLFTSGDFAPLRFDDDGGTGSLFGRPTVRTPELFAEPERASAFATPDVDTIPEDRAGSGFALQRTDTGDIVETDVPQGEAAARAESSDTIERVPDPTEPGVQFLEEEATPGTAFVRPSGDRTPEFEGVFPPGTEFERTTTGTITARSGETGTLDIFEPRTEQVVADGSGGTRGVTLSELSQRQGSSGGGVPDSTPIVPSPPATGDVSGTDPVDADGNNTTPVAASDPDVEPVISDDGIAAGGSPGDDTSGGGSAPGSVTPSSPASTPATSELSPALSSSTPTTSTPSSVSGSGSSSSTVGSGSGGSPSTTATDTVVTSTTPPTNPPGGRPDLPEFEVNADETDVGTDVAAVEETFTNPARGLGVVDDELSEIFGGVDGPP